MPTVPKTNIVRRTDIPLRSERRRPIGSGNGLCLSSQAKKRQPNLGEFHPALNKQQTNKAPYLATEHTIMLSTTADIALNAFSAMMKIAFMSFVGVFFAKYPRKKPILTIEFIQTLSKLSTNVFIPCLIVTSLGSGVNQDLLSRIGILILFCLIINGLSYTLAYTVGRCLHGTSDNLFTAMTVAIGSPNDMALPLMILSTICENDIINHDYDYNSKQCYAAGGSMLFVYSIGWHVMFWSYGFPLLKMLKEKPQLADMTVEASSSESAPMSLVSMSDPLSLREGEEDTVDGSNGTHNSSALDSRIRNSLSLCKPRILQVLQWLQSVLLTPAMIAIVLGIIIALTPPLQLMLFEDMSVFRPLGSAITTLGEPVVATSCLIMSASLAHVDLSRGRPRIHHIDNDGMELTAVDNDIAVVRSPLQSVMDTVKEYALLRGSFGLASTHGSVHGCVQPHLR